MREPRQASADEGESAEDEDCAEGTHLEVGAENGSQSIVALV